MSITFPTTDLKVPSGITALPSGMKRPGFGTLYGFDAQQGGGGGGVAFSIQAFDTEAAFIAQTDAPNYTIVHAKDTDKLYVWDDVRWHVFNVDNTV
jgi:hypothetical protein